MPINKKTSGWHPRAPRKASKAKRKRRKEKRTTESAHAWHMGGLGWWKVEQNWGKFSVEPGSESQRTWRLNKQRPWVFPVFQTVTDSPLTFSSLGKNASGWRRKSTRSGRLRQLARTWASRDGQSFSRTCWLLYVGEWWSIVWNWGQTHLDWSNFFWHI